ncbi:hypothetical protein LINPERHAP1_LOCUS3639 [Linum perenne]
MSALSGKVPSSAEPGKEWIGVGENDIISSVDNGFRSLQISETLKTKLCKPWTNSVIIRLMGKTIGYSYLCHRLKAMWRPLGSMHIVDIDRDCFIVKFSNEQDYFKALTAGPWMILEHYLVVQQWDPTFRVAETLPTKMVVWVRFPHLPILFYHPEILTALGNLIGRCVRVDFSTQNADRGKFARLAIELISTSCLRRWSKLMGLGRRSNMKISLHSTSNVGKSVTIQIIALANKLSSLAPPMPPLSWEVLIETPHQPTSRTVTARGWWWLASTGGHGGKLTQERKADQEEN